MGKLALRDKVFKNYTGGFNDTKTDYNMSDSELRDVTNCNIKKAVGGLTLRKGTEKINEDSLDGDVTRRFEYFLRLVSRKVFVLDYEVYFDGDPTPLVTVDIEKPHMFQRQDVLYISDNTDIYEYGQKDYFSSVGEVDVLEDDIVQVSNDHPNALIRGNFYQALSDLGTIDLSRQIS